MDETRRRQALDTLAIGDTARFRKTVSEADVYGFAGITGDMYGVHVDEEFAKTTRFGGRIAHGAMAVGFLSTVVGQIAARVPPPGAVSYRYDVTFTAPIRFGDTILAEVRVAEKNPERHEVILDARCSNQCDETVAKGRLILKVI
ncbi:MAG TPA: MaoC family dehydratase [Candidatus Methylomirabilis sp.]|nr:MaoC family dehydratase [Candidatus Methylomirabilis sp.]